MEKSAFILYYTKENRYSFNALLGALESTGRLKSVDAFFFNPQKNAALLEECLLRYPKVVFAFSFFTTQVWDIYRYLLSIKETREKYAGRLVLIAGGPHPSGEPKSVIGMGFDHVFVGEGEETINEFFAALQEGGDTRAIPGIYSRAEGEGYAYSARRGKVNLDLFLPFSEQYGRFGPIEITRGCPFACNFCQTTRIFGREARHRGIPFVKELLRIMKKHHLRDFRAITPNALAYGSPDGRAVNLSAVHELLSAVKSVLPEGRIFFGSFPSEIRPEHITEDSMRLLDEFVSNDNIILGAQTGSQRMLDLAHRGHTVQDVYRAVEIVLTHRKTPNVDFMFGLPGETAEDVDSTIAVMNDLIKMGARIHAHTFMPLPGTPFAGKGRGRISDEIRQYIRAHVSRGAVYGDWAEQARQSRKIETLLKTRRVDLSDL